MASLGRFPRASSPFKVSQGPQGQIERYQVPEGVRVLAVAPDGQLRLSPATLLSRYRNCQVETVELRSGRQIAATDHPSAVFGVQAGTLKLERTTPTDALERRFMVPRVIRLPEEVFADDRLETITTDTQPADTLALDADLGYLIGAVIGHDRIVGSSVMNLRRVNQEVAEKADVIAGRFFAEERPVVWTATELDDWIKMLISRVPRGKRLPPWFLRAPRPFRDGLFAGLMDTTGSVSTSARKKQPPQLLASFHSTNLHLCHEILLLAESLGIRGRITTETSGRALAWICNFANGEFQRWGGDMMVHSDKVAKLRSVPPIKPAAASICTDLIPISESLATAARKALGFSRAKRAKLGKSFSGVCAAITKACVTGYVTRASADNFTQFVDMAELEKHPDWAVWSAIRAQTAVTWELVVRVDRTCQIEDGYDLTVPGCDTFTDNDGIVLSAAL
jgi:hypothetical protein